MRANSCGERESVRRWKDKAVRKQDEFSSGASSDSADIDNGSTCHVADVYRLKGGIRMKLKQTLLSLNNKRGMEMVQVAILVAIAVAIGLILNRRSRTLSMILSAA